MYTQMFLFMWKLEDVTVSHVQIPVQEPEKEAGEPFVFNASVSCIFCSRTGYRRGSDPVAW